MKKTLIALSVSAAAVATGVNAAELYNQDGTSLDMGGRAEARLSMKDGKVADNSRIRLNFLGKVEIQDGLYGVGFYEGEFTTADEGENKTNNNLDNRYTYAGLGGKFGEVTYGKNDGALGVITDFTDIMAYHGNSAADKIAVADRVDNMIAYKGQFDALSVKASYRFADRSEGTGADAGKYVDNGQDGYSLSAIYAIGQTGLTLGGGYADQDEQNEYMLAASYTMGDLYFAGIYTDGEKAKKDGDYTGYELAAKYTMGQTVFTTTYNNAETNSQTSADNFAVDATYYFKPNFRGYVSYNFNLIDSGDKLGQVGGNTTASKIDAEDELALGLRYDF
ncbi:TPA: porin [Vibrio vulnificus]|uniref:Outer membrane protein OmpU n=1 Tax=Vibrio vulnificus TaxID=672 RepID=A0AAN1PLE9_VIBVL|nr:porin [Vibrio vulnificus]EWS70447.1 membrane protein [Vibrio vulnificus BAA87]OJI59692.1 Porin-like protein L precursor [Vibrio fluvialis]AXX58906.1 Outer membrane protein OmpU [Vibrio vulnificus]EIO3979318.1 porin [Vibrio vulnificus]EIU7613384.1 porin [Vibrio vulnificus]